MNSYHSLQWLIYADVKWHNFPFKARVSSGSCTWNVQCDVETVERNRAS